MRTFPFLLIAALAGTAACGAEDTTADVSDATALAAARLIERGSTCPQCSIAVGDVVVLGALEDEWPIGDGSELVALPGGNCIVGPTDRDGELLVFTGCRGAPRRFGVAGEGPGELGVIRTISRWSGDSVLAFGYGHFEVLDGTTGAGRSQRFDADIQATTILGLPTEARLVVNNDHHAHSQFGVLEHDGQVTATFGRPPLGTAAGDRNTNRTVLGRSARPETFWAAPRFYDLVIERWSTAGELLDRLVPEAAWYQAYDRDELERFWAVGAANARPLPFVRALHERRDGVIWISHAVAAAEWAPDSAQASPAVRRGGEVRRGSSSRAEHYDGMLSALDARTGALLVSAQIPDVIVGFLDDSTAYARRTGTDGIQQLAIVRLRLGR